MPSPRLAIVAVSLSLPAGLAAYACGGTSQSGASGDTADAADDYPHPPRHFEAGADAAEAGDAYTPKAPHCMRAADAGAPDPFDAGADAPPDVVALPQVTNLGGPVLRLPTFVSVSFADDPFAAELDDFVASVGCTDYWHAAVSDYGVGDGVAGTPVHLTEQAPTTIDDTAIDAWLAKKIDGGDAQFPRPAPETVYVLWYPDTTRITLQGQRSCQSFGGYHESGQLADGTPFVYAVLPRCQYGPGGLSGLAGATAAASHELAEACSDPLPLSAMPAFALPDPNHVGWALTFGSEIGDMCELEVDSFFQPTDFPWVVQRIWSNRAAWAGTNPCVPPAAPDYPYAAPVLPDTVMLNLTGTAQPVAAVHVAVGQSVTIPVQVFGNAGATLGVQAVDGSKYAGGPPHLGLTLDQATARPGDTIHLTISKQSGDPGLGAEPFLLFTTSASRQTVFWSVTSD